MTLRLTIALLVVLLLTGLLLHLHPAPYPAAPVLFEDGSFVVFLITGCLPWAVCAR